MSDIECQDCCEKGGCPKCFPGKWLEYQCTVADTRKASLLSPLMCKSWVRQFLGRGGGCWVGNCCGKFFPRLWLIIQLPPGHCVFRIKSGLELGPVFGATGAFQVMVGLYCCRWNLESTVSVNQEQLGQPTSCHPSLRTNGLWLVGVCVLWLINLSDGIYSWCSTSSSRKQGYI